MTYYCTRLFLTPKMFHWSAEAIQLYMMRQAGPPKESVFMGCWVVEGYCSSRGLVSVKVVLWILLHVFVADIELMTKSILNFILDYVKSGGGRCCHGFCVFGGLILCCMNLYCSIHLMELDWMHRF